MIILAYAAKLGLSIWKTSVKAQKIDATALKIYGMVMPRFSIQNSLKRVWFFEKTFLLANINIKIILGMSFLSLSNVKIQFNNQKLT